MTFLRVKNNNPILLFEYCRGDRLALPLLQFITIHECYYVEQSREPKGVKDQTSVRIVHRPFTIPVGFVLNANLLILVYNKYTLYEHGGCDAREQNTPRYGFRKICYLRDSNKTLQCSRRYFLLARAIYIIYILCVKSYY